MRRRVLGVLLGVVLLLAGAVPASALMRTGKSQSLNAFWYSTEPIGPNSFRNVVWYVGAFRFKGGTWSDLYVATDLCRNTRRGTVCQPESFAFGIKELSKGEFWIDETRLDAGTIDATYDLQAYDAFGNPVGSPVPTHILAEFEGLGEVQRYKEKFSYRDEHRVFTFTFHGFFRMGEAYGWVDGQSIGETYEAYLSLSTSTEEVRKH